MFLEVEFLVITQCGLIDLIKFLIKSIVYLNKGYIFAVYNKTNIMRNIDKAIESLNNFNKERSSKYKHVEYVIRAIGMVAILTTLILL